MKTPSTGPTSRTARSFATTSRPGRTGRFPSGDRSAAFTLQEDGRLLLFLDRGSVAIFSEGEPLEYVIDEILDETETRFNDVIADPEGRVGVLRDDADEGPPAAGLYRLDTDGTLTRVLDNIGCSNGMGFTPDGAQMYYTDTGARTIYLFDYDRATGKLTHQRGLRQSAKTAAATPTA